MREGEHRPVIVIPTNRIEQFNKWLEAWREQLKGCHLIVIYDGEKDDLVFVLNEPIFTYEFYTWEDIDKDLGKDAWIIPRRTDCVRSYGFLKALEHNPLFILTLDDDTKPFGQTIEDHYRILFNSKEPNYKYYNTMKYQLPRGYFRDFDDIFNKPNISHGTWFGTPDVDAHTQLTGYEETSEIDFNKGIIPQGSYVSTCGMNLAFKPEVTKYLYFGLQGQDYPIDRCGDIWAGYYASQKEDVLITTGYAAVYHDRASNAWSNLKKEKNAEHMGWLFRELACKGRDIESYMNYYDYWIKLEKAYEVWERLCNERFTRK